MKLKHLALGLIAATVLAGCSANHYKGFPTLSNLSFILNQLLAIFDKTNCFLQYRASL